MSNESRGWRWFVLLGLIAACARVPVAGPVPPAPPTISSVIITSLDAQHQPARVVDDRGKIRAIVASPAFSREGWVQADPERVAPLYRIDFRTAAGVAAVYWLGARSHPSTFPCYWFCSGWWVATSAATGDVDRSRYKPLPEGISLDLWRDLPRP